METKIFDLKGQDTGRKTFLNKKIFNILPLNHVIYLEIKRYLSANRQGTHKTKERGEVLRSKRKFQRQKGTGNARRGSLNSPIVKGGGRIFGPKPRSYKFKLNKSIKKLAKLSILSDKLKNNEIKIIENFNINRPKTKKIINLLCNFKLIGKSTLIIINQPNKNLYLSSRNIKYLNIKDINELSSYDLMNCSNLLILENTLSSLEKKLL